MENWIEVLKIVIWGLCTVETINCITNIINRIKRKRGK